MIWSRVLLLLLQIKYFSKQNLTQNDQIVHFIQNPLIYRYQNQMTDENQLEASYIVQRKVYTVHHIAILERKSQMQ